MRLLVVLKLTGNYLTVSFFYEEFGGIFNFEKLIICCLGHSTHAFCLRSKRRRSLPGSEQNFLHRLGSLPTLQAQASVAYAQQSFGLFFKF